MKRSNRRIQVGVFGLLVAAYALPLSSFASGDEGDHCTIDEDCDTGLVCISGVCGEELVVTARPTRPISIYVPPIRPQFTPLQLPWYATYKLQHTLADIPVCAQNSFSPYTYTLSDVRRGEPSGLIGAEDGVLPDEAIFGETRIDIDLSELTCEARCGSGRYEIHGDIRLSEDEIILAKWIWKDGSLQSALDQLHITIPHEEKHARILLDMVNCYQRSFRATDYGTMGACQGDLLRKGAAAHTKFGNQLYQETIHSGVILSCP